LEQSGALEQGSAPLGRVHHQQEDRSEGRSEKSAYEERRNGDRQQLACRWCGILFRDNAMDPTTPSPPHNASGNPADDITEDSVRLALRKVKDPELNLNIIDLGLVYQITVDEGQVVVNLVWEPFWTPERIEPKVRAYMGL
jgi:hypothetical protein